LPERASRFVREARSTLRPDRRRGWIGGQLVSSGACVVQRRDLAEPGFVRV